MAQKGLCRREQMGTKEFVKMLKRIQTLEEGRVPAKEADNGRIEGEKKRITRKEYQRVLSSLRWKVSGTKKVCRIWQRRKS